MKDQTKVFLKEAVSEIRMLRRQNEMMGARLGGFEDALLLLRTAPASHGQGMSPDLTYAIEKHLTSMEAEEERVGERK